MTPRVNLLLGLAVMALAVMETITGQSLGGYGSTADRTVNPRAYWWNVGTAYAFGLFFLGRYLYETYWVG